MTDRPAHETRLERILGVPLAEDAKRQWPQSGEVINGRARISEVESHFEGLRLGSAGAIGLGDTLVVEWSTDYGDGRVYCNVSVAELRDGRRSVSPTTGASRSSRPPEGRSSRLARDAGGRCVAARRGAAGRRRRPLRAVALPVLRKSDPYVATTAERSGRSRSSPREEAAELIPPRGGITWRIAGDARLFGASGYALLLRSPTRPSARGRSTRTSSADPGGGCCAPSTNELGGLRRSGSRLGGSGECGPTVSPTTRSSPARGPGHTPPWPSRSSAAMTSSVALAHRVPDRGLLGRVAADGPADRGPLPGPARDLARAARLLRPDGGGGARGHRGGPGRPLSLLDPAAPLPALRRDWIWRVVRWPSTTAGLLTTLDAAADAPRPPRREWSARAGSGAAPDRTRSAGRSFNAPVGTQLRSPLPALARGAIAGVPSSADGRGGHGLASTFDTR